MWCSACGVHRRHCGSIQKNFKTDGIMNHIWTQLSGFSLNLARGNLKKLHCSVCYCQNSECVQPVHPGSKEETRLFSFPSAAVRIMPQCVFRLFYTTACWNRACSPPVQKWTTNSFFFWERLVWVLQPWTNFVLCLASNLWASLYYYIRRNRTGLLMWW